MNPNTISKMVAELLLSQRTKYLPIDPLKLHYPLFIHFTTLENYCKNSLVSRSELSEYEDLEDGVTIISGTKEKRYIVIYNEAVKKRGRQSFTIAHEVGHILLAHEKDGDEEEKQADSFAVDLLMPYSLTKEIVRRFGENCTEEICHIFGVSEEAAGMRLRSLDDRILSEKEKDLFFLYKDLLPFLRTGNRI